MGIETLAEDLDVRDLGTFVIGELTIQQPDVLPNNNRTEKEKPEERGADTGGIRVPQNQASSQHSSSQLPQVACQGESHGMVPSTLSDSRSETQTDTPYSQTVNERETDGCTLADQTSEDVARQSVSHEADLEHDKNPQTNHSGEGASREATLGCDNSQRGVSVGIQGKYIARAEGTC